MNQAASFPGTVLSTDHENEIASLSTTVLPPEDLAFELGLWLSGLESFVGNYDRLFTDKDPATIPSRDWNRAFRLTKSALLFCSNLNYKLRRAVIDPDEEPSVSGRKNSRVSKVPLNTDDFDEFAILLRDAIVLNDSLVKTESLNFADWKSWKDYVLTKLSSNSAVSKLEKISEKCGEDYLPDALAKIVNGKKSSNQDESDLRLIFPRFAGIMKALDVVGRMLRNDEPLKPTLLIFSYVYEQTQDLIKYINNRLSRFPDEGAEIFNSLDAASYTASLELKKVFNQELSGVVGVRPAQTIYSRIETSHALLSDSFQQIVAGLARLLDPKTQSAEIFPNIQVKLEQSLVLRSDLSKVMQIVRAAEQNPEKTAIENMKGVLSGFTSDSFHYLFYKDKETVERFCEEVFIASENKDLVPILHRFGAYLETLFGQVANRSVLMEHPFEMGS